MINIESDFDYLCELIIKDHDFVRDGIDTVKEFISISSHEFSTNLQNALARYCVTHRLCIKCGEELESYTYEEDRGECCGMPCSERMTEWYCPNCD